MERPANISFLTPDENRCFELLLQAHDVFDKISTEDQQSPLDGSNFGRYMDSARSILLLRAMRRQDPENLLRKHRETFPTDLNTSCVPMDCVDAQGDKEKEE